MPSKRIETDTIDLDVFDAVGVYNKPGLVGHVGMAVREGKQSCASVEVLDMRPPLQVSGELSVHVFGSAILQNDEIRKLMVFNDRHSNEHASLQLLSGRTLLRHLPSFYCIYPHAVPYCHEDESYIRMRFSCVGFVFEAYKSAGINLFDETAVPMIDLGLLKEAYSDFAPLLDQPEFRDKMGLKTANEWPVILCGYIFHALSGDALEIRSGHYTPEPSHRSFL